jgi:thiamine-phosphate diphosphorylase
MRDGLSKMNRNDLIKNWQIYIITDEVLSQGRTHLEIAEATINAGVKVIQLRDKTASGMKLYKIARDIRELTREYKVAFIMNDRIDIALAVDADGVHVGQEDIPAEQARELIGPHRILGVSAGSLSEALDAEKQGADYLGVGPIFEARSTKADAGSPRGLDLINQIHQRCQLPLIAIGGINLSNIKDVIQAGASGAAVISAIVTAGNIEAKTKKFINAINK